MNVPKSEAAFLSSPAADDGNDSCEMFVFSGAVLLNKSGLLTCGVIKGLVPRPAHSLQPEALHFASLGWGGIN